MIKIINYGGVVLMVLALFWSGDYSFYEGLRWAMSGVFITNLLHGQKIGDNSIAWTMVVGLVLFNPLFPIHLSSGVWKFIDIATGIWLWALGTAVDEYE